MSVTGRERRKIFAVLYSQLNTIGLISRSGFSTSVTSSLVRVETTMNGTGYISAVGTQFEMLRGDSDIVGYYNWIMRFSTTQKRVKHFPEVLFTLCIGKHQSSAHNSVENLWHIVKFKMQKYGRSMFKNSASIEL